MLLDLPSPSFFFGFAMPRYRFPFALEGEVKRHKLRHAGSRRVKVFIKRQLNEGVPDDEIVRETLKLKAQLREKSRD